MHKMILNAVLYARETGFVLLGEDKISVGIEKSPRKIFQLKREYKVDVSCDEFYDLSYLRCLN
jgi:hypothetical protein